MKTMTPTSTPTECTCGSNHAGRTPRTAKALGTGRGGSGLGLNAVLRTDPTRTLTLRRAFVADVVRRFRTVMRGITQAVDENDVFGLRGVSRNPTFNVATTVPIPGPNQFAFATTQQKVDAFMGWLNEMADANILEVTTRTGGRAALDARWTDTYVRQAYQRGVDRGKAELSKIGYEMADAPVGGLFNQPMHADRLGMLYTRTFKELQGITSSMDTQISRVLTQGLAEGKNPKTIARELNRTVAGGKGLPPVQVRGGVSMSPMQRAKTMARTEIIRAHNVANVAEYRMAGLERGRIRAEFSTAGYGVCPICAQYEGAVMSLNDIEWLIPVHPNCRCVALPVLPGEVEVPVEETPAPRATPMPDAEYVQRAEAYRASLPAAESDTISEYIGVHYGRVNDALRTEAGRVGYISDGKARKMITNLDEALGSAPRLDKDLQVYRGVWDLDEAFPNGVRVGDILEDQAYLSTSVKRSVAEEFAGDAGYVFEIQMQEGQRAAFIAPQSVEKEVLLGRAKGLYEKTSMEVLGVDHETKTVQVMWRTR